MTGRARQSEPVTPRGAIATLRSEVTEQLARFHAYVRFASVDPQTNRWRFYDLLWQPTLFGDGALVRVWGRYHQCSTRRVTVYPDRAGALSAIRQVVRRRLRHGYRVVDWQERCFGC
jgi:predicted DNA-binding WGR domain protein